MEYQGEVLNSTNGEESIRNGVSRRSVEYINGEERVRNGVSRRRVEQYLWREESKEWSIKEKC